MRYASADHTRFYHRFHVVWGTKYRYKVLQGLMRERIREIIVQTCAEMGGPYRVRCAGPRPCAYVLVDTAKAGPVQRHAAHQRSLVATDLDGVT